MGDQFFHHRFARIDHLAGQQEVERAAQAVDVRAVVGTAAVQRLFRRHVIDRPHDDAADRHGRVRGGIGVLAQVAVEAGQAHVEDLDGPRRRPPAGCAA